MPEVIKKNKPFQEKRTEVNIINEMIKTYRIRHLIFMFIDPYQVMIGRQLFKRVKISGILFYAPLRMTALSRRDQFSIGLRKWVKLKILQWCQCNTNLHTIFILQDGKSAAMLNKNFPSTFFKPIVEPIEDKYINTTKRVNELFPAIAKHKEKFVGLVFGSISAFKNIPNILAAIELLDVKTRQELVLVIAGPYTSKKDEAYIEQLLLQHENLEIIRINKPIYDKEELSYLFENCSAVLMPYINFFGSSGVLGHAARFKKLVVAPSVGIINELVREYEMGLTCNPTDPNSIKNALTRLIEQPEELNKSARFNDFLSNRKPSLFAETLLLKNQ